MLAETVQASLRKCLPEPSLLEPPEYGCISRGAYENTVQYLSLSVTYHINCIVARCLINVVLLADYYPITGIISKILISD